MEIALEDSLLARTERRRAQEAAKSKRWRQCHPEKFREINRRNQAQWRARYPERTLWRGKFAAWQIMGRRLLVTQERGGSCVDCGYDNPLALEFDHRDPATKTGPVRRMRTLAEMRVEATKCDIRCANCHSLKTYYAGEMPRGGLWR